MARVEWKRLRAAEEVRARLLAELPPGSDASAIRSFATAQRLECSDPVGGVIRCSAPARGRWPLVSAKWLIECRLEDGRLVDIAVREGLTGP
ncbi:hypothetical protein [Streptomyces palmae]|uniref:Uncharacterized protein n=1 Tax=Streptomyces palmae TaxID=1701085 RepID=A0A4Z0H2J7_9ACTN|nr:hypothetical protein [Streptomyces palmae]TGB03294.1 hypothetical protein E4099_19665 [Streptomyces palmae]